MPNYCSNCGKKLIDGGVCDCVQDEDMHQQSYKCPYHQKGIQTAGINSRWIHGRKQLLMEQVKKVTCEVPDLFRRPDAAINRNVMAGSHSTVLMMIAFKALVLSLILCLIISHIKSRSDLLLEISLRKVILILIAAVFGGAYLKAGIFRGTVHLFKGQTTFRKMMSVAGMSSFIDGLCLAAGALLMMVIPRLGIIVILSGLVLRSLFYLNGYGHGVELGQDRKLYCFAAAQVCYIMVICIITYTAIPIISNNSVSGLLNYMLAALG